MSSAKTPARPREVTIVKKALEAIKTSRADLKELGVALAQIRFLLAQDASQPSRVAEQRLKWMVPVTQPLCLISQVQRSGGTLLARLFDGHPSCFAHPFELKWARPRKWDWPSLDPSADLTPDEFLSQLDEGWPQRFANVGFGKHSNWTRDHTPDDAPRQPFLFDPELQSRVFAEVLSRTPSPSRRDVLNAYLTSLFNAWLDYQNLYVGPKKWVTAFVPKLTGAPTSVEHFFTDYPDGVLITIVRDPGAWLASASRQQTEQTDEEALDEWTVSAESSVAAHARHADRVVVVMFEDLVTRTEAVMRRLATRLDIAFTPGLLEPTYNSMPVLSDSSYAPVLGVDASAAQRYRSTLTPHQLELVNGGAMLRFTKIREQFSIAPVQV